MKRTVDTLFALIPPVAIVLVAVIFQWQLDRERTNSAALRQVYEAQGKTLEQRNSAWLETGQSLNGALADLALCTEQTNGLLATLQATQQLAAMLEGEVDRLKPLRTVTAIIVHHSDSTFGDVPTVDHWHRQRQFDGIGYHYLITNGQCGGHDGEIQFGRPEEVQGAHAKSNHRNVGTIGVCLIGKEQFTPAQHNSLQALLVHLCRRHGLTPSAVTIQPHHERCPGLGLDLGGITRELTRK